MLLNRMHSCVDFITMMGETKKKKNSKINIRHEQWHKIDGFDLLYVYFYHAHKHALNCHRNFRTNLKKQNENCNRNGYCSLL